MFLIQMGQYHQINVVTSIEYLENQNFHLYLHLLKYIQPKIYQIAEITLKNTAICSAAFEVVEQMKKEIK